MGFVQNKQEDEDDLGGLLATQADTEKRESKAHGNRGLVVSTDVLKCATCRRELLPWQATCPDDGGEGVDPADLPPEEDPLLARFLAQQQDGGLPDPGELG